MRNWLVHYKSVCGVYGGVGTFIHPTCDLEGFRKRLEEASGYEILFIFVLEVSKELVEINEHAIAMNSTKGWTFYKHGNVEYH